MATVLYEVSDGVATITLNRPDRLNAMTLEMSHAYAEALGRADAEPAVRAIVVTGAGRGFCAGADLAALAAGPDVGADASAGPRPEVALSCRKPVIAAVNGPAAGLGFVIMLTADVRFVATDAKLTTSFARLGLIAEYGSAWLLTRLIGLGPATDLLLSARTITGAEAVELGLATRATPAADVLATALDYARTIARTCSPRSLATIKAQLRTDLERPFAESLANAEDLMRASFTGADLAEGVLAQQARRDPAFADLTE